MRQSMNSMNSMAEWIKKLNSDVDIKNRLEANSGDKAAYDAAVKQIEDAVNRFNDAVKNSSWQEIENILKELLKKWCYISMNYNVRMACFTMLLTYRFFGEEEMAGWQ